MPPVVPKITVEGLIGSSKKTSRSEPDVISDASLSVLAKAVGNQGMLMAMYLNIPTTTLVRGQLKCEANGENLTLLTEHALKYWKKMRTTAKPKDKVNDLVRALKMMPDKEEWGKTIEDRYKEQLDLTPDLFM